MRNFIPDPPCKADERSRPRSTPQPIACAVRGSAVEGSCRDRLQQIAEQLFLGAVDRAEAAGTPTHQVVAGSKDPMARKQQAQVVILSAAGDALTPRRHKPLDAVDPSDGDFGGLGATDALHPIPRTDVAHPTLLLQILPPRPPFGAALKKSGSEDGGENALS